MHTEWTMLASGGVAESRNHVCKMKADFGMALAHTQAPLDKKGHAIDVGQPSFKIMNNQSLGRSIG